MYWKFISLNEILITWSQKDLAKPQSQIQNIYFKKGKIKNSRGHLCSSNMEIRICNFIIRFGNIFFPILAAEWLRLVLSTEYPISRQMYLFDIRSVAWLNLFWEYINGKLFAVQQKTKTSARRTWKILGLGNGREKQQIYKRWYLLSVLTS